MNPWRQLLASVTERWLMILPLAPTAPGRTTLTAEGEMVPGANWFLKPSLPRPLVPLKDILPGGLAVASILCFSHTTIAYLPISQFNSNGLGAKGKAECFFG
jgi:hypothetical protein